MGLTFKTNNPTGRYRSFSHIYILIKLDKQEVGSINWVSYMGTHDGKKDGMRVSIRVKDFESACGWKNVTLVKTFEGWSDKEQGKAAKEWVKENWKIISEKHQICPLTEQPTML